MFESLAVPCSGSLDYSFASSSQRDPTYRCLIRFPNEFFDPADEITAWYTDQPRKRFNTIQYRKERTKIGHEFILVLLLEEGKVVSYCRVERAGDPEHKFQVMRTDGTVALDFIQAIPLENPKCRSLVQNSDVVAQITFPVTYDLRDVLAICYGISKQRRSQRYTLQQYNCYFFSWTIIIALGRANLNWDLSGSVQEHIQNIRCRMSKLINDQGLERFDSLAYITSNHAYPSHGDANKHPLNLPVHDWIHSPELAQLVLEMLQNMLWTQKLRSSITHCLELAIGRLAHGTFQSIIEPELVRQLQHKSDSRHNLGCKFERRVHKLTWEAVNIGHQTYQKLLTITLGRLSEDMDIVKHRMNPKSWGKCTKNFILASRRPEDCQSTDSHLYESTGPLFPSIVTGYLDDDNPDSYFKITGYNLEMFLPFFLRTSMTLTFSHYGGGSIIRRTGRIVRNTIHLGVRDAYRMYPVSRQLLCAFMFCNTETTAELTPHEHTGFIDDFRVQMNRTFREGLSRGLSYLNNGLRKLIEDHHTTSLNVLHPFSLTLLVDLGKMGHRPGAEVAWRAVLQQQFLDGAVEEAYQELKSFVEAADLETMVKATEVKYDTNDHGQSGICEDEAGATSSTTTATKGKMGYPNEADSQPKIQNYTELQEFISRRISQLSTREIQAPSSLKYKELKFGDICQTQIEETMEDVWQICRPLMTVTRH